jgi:hypothetical protein
VAEPLHLVVWTPSEVLLDVQPVEWVHVELAGDKSLTIWPGHLAMLGETAPAAITYLDGGGQHSVELPPGIVQVDRGTVHVFLSGSLGEKTTESDAWEPLERLAEDLVPVMNEVRSRLG